MLSFRHLSLQRKQMLIIMLTSSTVLLLACAAFVAYDVSRFRRELVESVSSLAEVVGNNLTAALDFNDPAAATQTLGALRGEPDIVMAHVHARDDRVFATYARDDAKVPPAVPHSILARHEFTTHHLHLFRPITQGSERVGTIEVVVTLDELERRVWRYAGIAALVLVVSLLAAFGLSNQLQKLVSDPILQLARVARSVALEKNYSVRASKQGNDELGQLVDGFNEMLSQIQHRDLALQLARGNLERRVEERTKELAQSVSLLSATLESTGDGILVISKDFIVTSFNTRFLDLWRVPSGLAVVGEEDRVLPLAEEQMKDSRRFLARVHEIYAQPAAESHDVFELKDGRLIETNSQSQRLNGDCVGRVWSFRDITERRRAEQELQRQQTELRVLFDLMPALIWFKDTENRILRVNQRAAEAAGKSVEEIEGRPSSEIYPREAAQFYADDLTIIRSGMPKLGYVEMLRDQHGKELWVQTDKVPVRDRAGLMTGIVVMSQDITERKRAEESLRLLSSAVEQSRESILITDAELDLPGPRIIFINPAFTQMTGYSAEETLGKTPRVLQGPHTDRAVLRRLRQNLERGEGFAGEAINYRKDGSEFHLEWQIAPIRNPDGKTTHFVAIQRDVTERKRVQAELEATHKQLMDSSRRSGMAEIATNVLHNVGNVLNSVNISTGLILESVKKSRVSNLARVVDLLAEHTHDLGIFITEDERGKHVPAHLAQLAGHLTADRDAVIGELDSLRRNVEHIKEIVAMQQNYATFGGVKEQIDVVSLVEDALQMSEGALTRHHVTLIREFSPVPPLNVEKHKILQIMVNLLRNAKHACQESERPDKRLTVRVANGDGRIKISVIDNGVGIPPENLTRIFNHGFTTRKDGHGFGLHSGALAAHEIGGSLTAQSDGPGRGATFVLELPCSQPETLHE